MPAPKGNRLLAVLLAFAGAVLWILYARGAWFLGPLFLLPWFFLVEWTDRRIGFPLLVVGLWIASLDVLHWLWRSFGLVAGAAGFLLLGLAFSWVIWWSWWDARKPLVVGLRVATGWVLWDVLRGIGYFSVPWIFLGNGLANEQGVFPWVGALARWGGVQAVGWMLVACNLLLYWILRREWRAAGGLTAAMALVTTGAQVGADLQTVGSLRAAVVQWGRALAWMSPEESQKIGEQALQYHRDQLQELRDQAELVVFAESFVPFVDSPDSALQRWLRSALDREMKLVYGLGLVEEEGDANAMFFLDRRRLLAIYRKHQLAYMGEYVPLRRLLVRLLPGYPWPAGDLREGKAVYPVDLRGLRVGPLICFETLHPALARWYAAWGAEVFVAGVNSGWLGTERANRQMAAMEVYRVWETGRPLVRAGNGGPSVIWDGEGRPQAGLPPGEQGRATAEVPRRRGTTFFVRHGAWLAWWSAGLFFLLLGSHGKDTL